jgi:hypothetical protein
VRRKILAGFAVLLLLGGAAASYLVGYERGQASERTSPEIDKLLVDGLTILESEGYVIRNNTWELTKQLTATEAGAKVHGYLLGKFPSQTDIRQLECTANDFDKVSVSWIVVCTYGSNRGTYTYRINDRTRQVSTIAPGTD